MSRIIKAALLLAALCINGTVLAQPFSFVAIGDAPYQMPAGVAQVERLITRINRQQPAFTIHIGDIKNGSSRCDDSHFELIRGMFATFAQPLVYTPGDNDWTDCHRDNNGGYDPLERLARLREMFYPSPGMSLGRSPMPLDTQSADPKFAKFVENTRWEKSGVHFATIHVIGSNNNLQRDQAAVNEYIERNAANLAWINSTFARAMQSAARAVVIAFQADPLWGLEANEDQRSGFTDTIRALKANTIRFGKPVLIIHGDEHRLIIDKPLMQAGRVIYNATRLMVYGDQEVHGVLVSVDPDDADVFSFKSLTVPENRPAATQ